MRGLFITLISGLALVGAAKASAHCHCGNPLPQTNGGQHSTVTTQHGVKIIRPQARPVRIIYAGSGSAPRGDTQDEFSHKRDAQDRRLDGLEDRQDVLQGDIDSLYHPQTVYPTINGRRVYIAGDPRFAGPNGYNSAPQQRTIRLDGVGVVPAPRTRPRRRLIRGRIN